MSVLLLAELLLRLCMPQPLRWDMTAVWEPAAALGWQRKPHLDVEVHTGERRVRVLSDAAGHRIGLTATGPGERRILAVGDSFVEALQVPAEQTMTALLSAALSQRYRQQVQVTNAGVGGWDPNQYRIAVQRELQQARYDLVLVFVYVENDVIEKRVDHIAPTTRFTPLPQRYGSVAEVWQTVTMQAQLWLQHYSHAYVFARNYLEMQKMRAGVRTQHFLTNIMRSYATAPAWQVTGEVLAEIATQAAQYATPVLYILLPPPHYIDEHLLATYTRAFGLDMAQVDASQPVRLLLAALAERGLQAVDATGALRAAFEAGERGLYGRVDKHFAPAGHQVMARFLEPIVMQHLKQD